MQHEFQQLMTEGDLQKTLDRQNKVLASCSPHAAHESCLSVTMLDERHILNWLSWVAPD